MEELQGIGLEAIIAEENTSQEDLTSHEEDPLNLMDSHADTCKMTTELDHDHILDYSNINIQYGKQHQPSHTDQIKKIQLDLRILQN